MLYHWHELDPKSAPVADEAKSTAPHRHQISIAYDAAAAVVRARGGPMRIDFTTATRAAANDCDPNANAARLRSAGVGVADYRIWRARARVTQGAWHTLARYASLVATMAVRLPHALQLVMPTRARVVTGCSHTIVSNDKDDRPRVYNGAL